MKGDTGVSGLLDCDAWLARLRLVVVMEGGSRPRLPPSEAEYEAADIEFVSVEQESLTWY
jgi:hypothetical protein